MFGSTLLDVAIGVVFIYLYLSLVGAVVTELIANVLNMRARNMESWVRKVLQDAPGNGGTALRDRFYGHPLLKGICQDGRKPSYIPSRTFSLVLLDIIAPLDPLKGSRTLGDLRDSVNKLPEDLKRTMLVHINEAQDDLNAVRQNIEKWFDDSMERVAGWYKRKSQAIVLVLSFFIAIGMNVDTISLVARLYDNSSLRADLVASAEMMLKQSLSEGDAVKKDVALMNDQLKAMNFPLGWQKGNRDVDFVRFIGWIITALAVSLGAPFWFDTLGKIINVRNAGSKPKKAEEGTA